MIEISKEHLFKFSDETVKKDAFRALKYVANRSNKNTDPNYSIIYRLTNENLEYLRNFDIEGKRVLSVAASGDHYLTSLLFNPSEVEIYDLNVLTYYYVYLKIIAFCALSPEDFKTYFVYGTGSNQDYRDNICFNYDIYLKFRNYLPQNIREFWDFFYSLSDQPAVIGYKKYGETALIRMLFTSPHGYIPTYLSDEKYRSLQEILSKRKLPTFHHLDIRNIESYGLGSFDIILTSNIYNHAGNDHSWKDFVINVLGKHLNEDGLVQAHYFWNYYGCSDMYSFFEPELFKMVFESVIPGHNKDAIYVYKSK